MLRHFFPYLRFHFRRALHTQLGWLLACLAAFVILVVAVVLWTWQWNQLHSLKQEASRLQTAVVQRQQENAETAKKIQAPIVLPAFHNASFIRSLHKVAGRSHLALNEMSYVLDEAPTQPYLRYRIQFSVLSNYPSLRRFIKDMHAEFGHVTLDSMSCSREDITFAELNCDLSFTAFFARGERG
jgi:Tfp pilus assembly protein PilO